MRGSPLSVVMIVVSACSLDPWAPSVGGRPDGGRRDAGTFDAAVSDAGPFDAGARDAGSRDAGVFDGGPGDDAGPPDGGCPPDLCDGINDHCDGRTTVDGSGEPTIGTPCDGADTDLCEEGVVVCVGGALACDDTTGSTGETCNAIDDDCDGMIDIGAGCPCEVRLRGAEPYLFCDNEERWEVAWTECRAHGYNVATIDDLAESDWVAMQAFMIQNRDWWIGLNDWAMRGSLRWASGSLVAYRNWGPAEPRILSVAGAARIEDGTDGVRGTWSFRETRLNSPYVCSLP